jgi:hypothetical protein
MPTHVFIAVNILYFRNYVAAGRHILTLLSVMPLTAIGLCAFVWKILSKMKSLTSQNRLGTISVGGLRACTWHFFAATYSRNDDMSSGGHFDKVSKTFSDSSEYFHTGRQEEVLTRNIKKQWCLVSVAIYRFEIVIYLHYYFVSNYRFFVSNYR